MRGLFVLLFILGIGSLSFAQELEEETRNGKTYKVHLVEAGNTLYGLHIKYGVDIEDIIKENPTVADGLKVGQKIYIPFDKSKVKEEKTKIHKVKRKETLFGISKMYECSVDDLIRLNPGVEEGLKTGQEIVVPVSSKEENLPVEDQIPEESQAEKEVPVENEEPPAEEEEVEAEEQVEEATEVDEPNYKIEFTDSIIEYEVQKGETLYSISRRFMVPVEKLVADNNIQGNNIKPGQVLRILLKKERISEVESRDIGEPVGTEVWDRPTLIQEKDNYKVLVALPMRISQNPKVISGMYDDKTSLNALTELSVSFFMGAKLALDSLEKLGLNAEVEFFDTDGDLNKFKEHLGATNLKVYDMLIGPFYPKLMEYAATWALENKVPVVAVTKIPTKLLENNPYVISTVPSDLTLIGGMAKYLAELENANIIIIDGENETARQNVAYFKTVFNRYNKGNNLRASSTSGLAGFMDAQKDNYYVCLTNNVQQVMRFTNALNAAKNTNATTKKAKVMMVGMKEWIDITALTSYYRNRFEMHYASGNYLNYEDSLSNQFTQNFREVYGSDPSKYAFHGYDIVMAQLSHYLLGLNRNKGLMNEFKLNPVGSRHGNENSVVFITKQADFEKVLLKVEYLD